MAEKKKKRNRRRRRLSAPIVVLCIVLTLSLSAGIVYGLYSYGSSRPAPAALRPAAEASTRQVSVYTDPEPVVGEAPAPAQAPSLTDAEEEEFGYREILYDQDGLLVARIVGKRYVGFIAVVDDPMRVTLGKCPYFGPTAYGRRVDQMADEAGAILAVNGGGFTDTNGVGKGGSPTGNVFYNGEMLAGYTSPTVGMDANGRMHVGTLSAAQCRELGLQWAVSYGPTLVQDGQLCVGLDVNSQEPRTAIGQREDGAVVLVALQGRQLQALGVTCRKLGQIMLGYGCVCASNLDGGASSDMYFQGVKNMTAETGSGMASLVYTIKTGTQNGTTINESKSGT